MAVTKVINSEEKQFRPVLVDKVVLDAVPTVNSFNSVTSDGVARAIAGASGEVPVVTENDNGKVLTAVYDAGGPAVEWGEAVTVDQTYDATSTNAQSGTAVAEAVGGVAAVPAVSSTDDGKVLKASYDSVAGTGSFSWETQTTPTVDQVYDASSTNAQSGTAVAGAIAGVNQVPASTSTDANKVLTVDSQGVPGWATPAAPAGGDSDEWWGGDPGTVTLSNKTVRLKFKNLNYDPRNDPDSTFTGKFSSITKVEDGIYDFTISSKNYANTFKDKYLVDNEFIIVGFNGYNGEQWRTAQSMFQGCTGLRAVYNYSVNSTNGSNNSSHAFNGCTNLVEFHATRMAGGNSNFSSMFYNCSSLKLCDASLQALDSMYTTNCSSMFCGCTKLVTGPYFRYGLSDTSYMFENCESLSGFVYKPVPNESLSCYKIVTNVNGSSMFKGCKSLETANMPFFNFHVFYNVSSMFEGNVSLRTPPSVLRISSASAAYAFNMCYNLEKLPNMDYDEITLAQYMFGDCVMLTDVSPLATVTWNEALTNVSSMFVYCRSIQKGLKDVYDNMAATATITTHSGTFTGCGTAFSNPDLALIPTSWGGGAA